MRLVPRRTGPRALLALALALGLAGGLVALDLDRTGRARPPLAARGTAVAAFEKARSGPAPTWAKGPLAAAETALREALLGWSRQASRFVGLRDFRPVATALAKAESLALEADRAARAAEDDALFTARRAVAQAQSLEEHAEALGSVTTLPPAQRARLQRARLLVREAEALLRSGEVADAQERAQRSRDELRAALGPVLEAALRYTSADQVATWRRWVDETRVWSRKTGQLAIVVLKEKHTLVLLSKGRPLRTYDAELGANLLGSKQRQGDRATPEGHYRIVAKKDKGRSRYHRALLLDYPNAADKARFARAQRRGEIPRGARIGGLIEIHGDGGRGENWTDGCVALANPDMDDLYRRVGVGTRVTIVGGDGRGGAFSGTLARVGAEAEGGRP